jgi:thiamine transport system permease protein
MGRIQARHALILLPVLFLLFLVVLPLGRLLLLGAGGLSLDFFSDAYLRWRLLWSVLQALISCLLSLLLGLPVAWVLARFTFPGRTLLVKFILLPFVMPTLVGALGVLALFGPHGVLGIDLQDSPWLLLYGNLFFNLPLLIRVAQDGFSLIPASRLAAARTLGASRWRVFWRVELPAVLPFACSALCLVFLYCFSGFGLALILGGQHYATVEVEIYSLVANEMNFHDAAALALASFVLTGGCALVYAWLERFLARPLQGMQQVRLPVRGLHQQAMLWLALLIILFFSLAPLLAIVWRALAAGAGAWAIMLDADTLSALANTARFTGLTLVAALLFGLAHACALRRSVGFRALSFLPYAASPVCVAFGLLLLYPGLSASLVLLLGAYSLLAYPFVARSMAAALDAVAPHYPEAARTLGCSPWRCAWRVWLPLVMPALRRGMVFAAASAMGEFAVTLFLSRPEWTTLTTLIYQHMGRPGERNLDAAMVLSCVLMLLALLAFAVIEWPESRRVEC